MNFFNNNINFYKLKTTLNKIYMKTDYNIFIHIMKKYTNNNNKNLT